MATSTKKATPKHRITLIDLHHPRGGYLRLEARRRMGWSWIGGDSYYWRPEVEVAPLWNLLAQEIRAELIPEEQRKFRGVSGLLPYWHVPSRLERRVRDTILAIPAHWQWGPRGEHRETVKAPAHA